jgi:uncharacterized MnhB-related membrane protein
MKMKHIKFLIAIIFYLTSIYGFICILTDQFYITLIMIGIWNLFVILPYRYLFKKKDVFEAYTDFFSIIDDPIKKWKRNN